MSDKDGEYALAQVRALCDMYANSAESVGSEIFNDHDETLTDFQKRRYEEGRKKALEIAILIKDDVRRDSALQAALDFCMKAKDLTLAVLIIKAIAVREIQEQIVKSHGDYFILDEKAGRLVSSPAAAIDPSLE